MYERGRKTKSKIFNTPFTVICNNCGSHDVTITAFEFHDLEIKCRECGAYLSYGSYNENEYYEEDD